MATLLALSLLAGARLAAAAGSEPFYWSFPNQDDLTSAVEQCTALTISLYAGSMQVSDLTPPMILYTYPLNSIPSSTTLTSAGSGKYSWTPAYGTGTQMAMGLFDSAGNSGGFVGVYTIAISSDSSCIGQLSTDMTLKLNTTSVDVCGTVGISVSGGTAPYEINVIPFGTISDFLNSSIPAGDSGYDWVANTTTPNTMMVSVRDSTGTYAPSSDLITITGQNGTCFTQSNATSTAPAGSASGGGSSSGGGGGGKKSDAGTIAGAVVGSLLGVALLAAAVWFFFFRRRRGGPVYADGESADGASAKEGFGSGGAAFAGKGAAGKGRRASRDALAHPPHSRSNSNLDIAGVGRGRKGKEGRRAGVPAPEQDVEKGEDADAPEARITPFTGGLPDIDAGEELLVGVGGSPTPIAAQHMARDRKGLENPRGHRYGQSAGGSSTRPSTGDSTARASQGGFGGLRVANPDADEEGDGAGPSAAWWGSGAGTPKGAKGPLREPQYRRVIQHQDAETDAEDEGTEELPPEELPPAYASIKPKKGKAAAAGPSGSGS